MTAIHDLGRLTAALTRNAIQSSCGGYQQEKREGVNMMRHGEKQLLGFDA